MSSWRKIKAQWQENEYIGQSVVAMQDLFKDSSWCAKLNMVPTRFETLL